MQRWFFVSFLTAVFAATAITAPAAPNKPLRLDSTTFSPGGTMPASTVYNKDGCRGGNVSPDLRWSGAPKRTRSFALIVHDPDAPAPGGWYHWVVYNLPPADRHLSAGATLRDDQLGTTSFDENRYGGPCPPPGKPHHYDFSLYALDQARIETEGRHLTGPEVEQRIRGHVLAKAVLTGLYGQ